MNWDRVWASLVNWLGFFFIVNIVFWILNQPLLGERWFGVPLPEGRLNLFIFSLLSFFIFGSIIGWLINVYFWATNRESIPNLVFYALMN